MAKIAEKMIFILLNNNLEKEIEQDKGIHDFVKLMKVDHTLLPSSGRESLADPKVNPHEFSCQISKSQPGTAF